MLPGILMLIAGMSEGCALFDKDLQLISANDRYRQALALPNLAPGGKLDDIWRRAATAGCFAGIAGPGSSGSGGSGPGSSGPGLPEALSLNMFLAGWRQLFKTETPARRDLALGDGRWLLVSHQPWRQAGIDFYLMTLTEVTAYKQRERELVAAHDQVEVRLRDLERYSGDVEDARQRVESQAADYVGLMEELAVAQGETQRAHAATQLKEEQLRRMTDRLPVLVADIDAAGLYRYCNDRYLDFFDWRASDVIGQHVAHVYGEEAFALLRPDMDRVLEGREVSFRRSMQSHGETRQLEGRYIPQVDANGATGGFYVAAWDVTEHYRRELELDREVKTDALTGLLNRRALLEALSGLARDLSAAGETATQQNARGAGVAEQDQQRRATAAVLYLDIDHFKQINDTFGHAAGDQLLKIFAQRLRGSVRGSDKVARLGGDEFVVLLYDIGVSQNAERVAQKIIDRMRDSVGLDGRMIEIGTSIGIAHSPGQQVTPDFLLQEADAALYEAKKAGRGTYRLHLVKPVVELT